MYPNETDTIVAKRIENKSKSLREFKVKKSEELDFLDYEVSAAKCDLLQSCATKYHFFSSMYTGNPNYLNSPRPAMFRYYYKKLNVSFGRIRL